MPKITNRVPDTTHLYQGEDGKIYDGHIEHMFNDLYSEETPDGITFRNLRAYSAMIFKDSLQPPNDVFTNDLAAIEWCASIGTVSLAAIDKRLHNDPDIEALGLRFICRFSYAKPNAQSTMGKSLGRAALLGLVQSMREHAMDHNNRERDTAIRQ